MYMYSVFHLNTFFNKYTFFLFKYCFYKDTGRLLRGTFNRFKIVVNFHETRLLRMYAKCTEIDEPPILHLNIELILTQNVTSLAL